MVSESEESKVKQEPEIQPPKEKKEKKLKPIAYHDVVCPGSMGSGWGDTGCIR
jgi:hypothetical protein